MSLASKSKQRPVDVDASLSRKRRHADGDYKDVKVRREHAATYSAKVDNTDVKRKLEILKRSTLRPIVIYYEPDDAKLPELKWRIYPFKQLTLLHIVYVHRQSYYVIGRNAKVSDIQIRHVSCSNQHAVLQYRQVDGQVKPFVMDLKSMNGTFVNGLKVVPLNYVELFEKDVLQFGFSTREYILLHENSACLQKASKGISSPGMYV